MRVHSGRDFFEQYMTREAVILANDQLRQYFRGGRIEVCRGPYEIDDRTMGRMLCAVGKYNAFSPESLHDEGVFVFGGFAVAWTIRTVDQERVMRIWINYDVLQSA